MVFGVLKNSTPYKMSVDYVMHSEYLQNQIGPVTKIGYFPAGHM